MKATPLTFVENRGQWNERVRFAARASGVSISLCEQSFALSLTSADGQDASSIAMRFMGASKNPSVQGERSLPGVHNFLSGKERSEWRSGVAGFESVLYCDLYPGIDMRVREGAVGIEYDFLLAPQASVEQIQVKCDGAQALQLTEDGALEIHTVLGVIRQAPPTTWQVAPDGSRLSVPCEYRIHGGVSFGLALPEYDKSLATVIDPGVEWLDVFGGSQDDFATTVDFDPQTGETTLGGSTRGVFVPGEINLPTLGNPFDGTIGSNDVEGFIARYDANGTRLWTTYVGGSGEDTVSDLAVVPGGEVIATGVTTSSDFVTVGSPPSILRGVSDAYILRLNSTGSAAVYSRYIGGPGAESASGLDLYSNGDIAICGRATSTNFLPAPALLPFINSGGGDAFVARINAAGTLVTSLAFLGGSASDFAADVSVDGTGRVVVVGTTASGNFSLQNPFDSSLGGNTDGFVSRLQGNLGSLIYSTYLGGSGVDNLNAVDTDAAGVATVGGGTISTDYPVTMPPSTQSSASATLTRIQPLGTGALVYSRALGGVAGEAINDLKLLDPSGTVVATGGTSSPDFPFTDGTAQEFGVPGMFGDAALVLHVSADGTNLIHADGIGERSGSTDGTAIAVADECSVIVAGVTVADLSVPGGTPMPPVGRLDTFTLRHDLQPTAVTKRGPSSPACSGEICAGGVGNPSASNSSFEISCYNAPPNASGVLFIALGPNAADIPGTPIFGITGLVDLTFPPLQIPVTSNADGFVTVPISLTTGLVGVNFACQFWWVGTPSCPGAPPLGLAASTALDFVALP